MFKQALKMTSSSETCLITGEKAVGNFEVLNNSQQFITVAFCETFLYMHCFANFLTESNQIASSREKPAGYKEV